MIGRLIGFRGPIGLVMYNEWSPGLSSLPLDRRLHRVLRLVCAVQFTFGGFKSRLGYLFYLWSRPCLNPTSRSSEVNVDLQPCLGCDTFHHYLTSPRHPMPFISVNAQDLHASHHDPFATRRSAIFCHGHDDYCSRSSARCTFFPDGPDQG